MPSFLLLLHSEGTLGALADAEKAALFQQFVAWSESLKARGRLRAVESLMDAGGTTVRKQRDAIVVDGPYAEIKELVSGLFVIDAADAAEAQQLAGECPMLGVGGAVEVRLISPFPVRP